MDKLRIVQKYYDDLLNEPIFNPPQIAIARARALQKFEEGEFTKMSELELYRELQNIVLYEFWVFHNWHQHKTLGIPAAIPFDSSIEFPDDNFPVED